MSFILYLIHAVSVMLPLQCCQFGDFAAKFSYFLIVAGTFIDFLRQGAILAIFQSFIIRFFYFPWPRPHPRPVTSHVCSQSCQ